MRTGSVRPAVTESCGLISCGGKNWAQQPPEAVDYLYPTVLLQQEHSAELSVHSLSCYAHSPPTLLSIALSLCSASEHEGKMEGATHDQQIKSLLQPGVVLLIEQRADVCTQREESLICPVNLTEVKVMLREPKHHNFPP